MSFDPSKYKPKQFDNSPLPAGRYLLVIETIEQREGKTSKRPYLNARYRVISGPLKGRTFFATIGVDIHHPQYGGTTAGRLSAMCVALRSTEPVELGNVNTLVRAWCNRPFKAEVSQKQMGQYVNNDIRKYAIDEKDVAASERQVMDEWRAEYLAKAGFDGDGDDDDDFGDDQDDGGFGGGGSSNPPFDGDDEIPF